MKDRFLSYIGIGIYSYKPNGSNVFFLENSFEPKEALRVTKDALQLAKRLKPYNT